MIDYDLAFSLLLCVLLVAGAWIDAQYRLLPNWLAGLVLVCGIVSALLGGGWIELGWHLAHGLIALLVGFALFARSWLGGGDAKVYAALAANFPLGDGIKLLSLTAVSILLVVGVWFAISRFLRRRNVNAPGDRKSDYAKVPLGVAIALGGIALVVYERTGLLL